MWLHWIQLLLACFRFHVSWLGFHFHNGLILHGPTSFLPAPMVHSALAVHTGYVNAFVPGLEFSPVALLDAFLYETVRIFQFHCFVTFVVANARLERILEPLWDRKCLVADRILQEGPYRSFIHFRKSSSRQVASWPAMCWVYSLLMATNYRWTIDFSAATVMIRRLTGKRWMPEAHTCVAGKRFWPFARSLHACQLALVGKKSGKKASEDRDFRFGSDGAYFSEAQSPAS